MNADFLQIGNGEAVKRDRIPHLAFDDFRSQALAVVANGGKVVQFFAYPEGDQVNPLAVLRDWVRDGGSLAMCGGYLSFSGFEAKAHFHGTPVEEVLPVLIATDDDRVECPEGRRPRLSGVDHPVTAGLADEWPTILGYNRTRAAEDATVLATAGEDPFVAVAEPGRGRSLVWTGDVGPHWAPTEMVDSEVYRRFWAQAVSWLCRR